MQITLREWLEMYQLASEATTVIHALSGAINRIMFRHMGLNNHSESELLTKISNRVFNTAADIAQSLYVPQTEWLGGDSADPWNHTVREPNWVHMGKRFPPKQVAEFRQENGKIQFPVIRNGENQPGVWDVDEEFPVADWQYEVANADTRLGYWDWVAEQREAKAA